MTDDVLHDRSDPGPNATPPQAGMPTWVKVSLLVVVALIAIVLVAKVAGIGGEHGPQRHGRGDRPSVTAEGGHRPPVDHAP